MFDPRYGEDFSVDFNDVLPDPDYPRHVISDEEATALYFANHSVSLLRNGDLRAAFANLKKSLELWPDNPDFWINLGAFYSKQQALGEALGAYQTALYHDPYNRGALSGLARTNQLLGNEAKAREYGELVRRYRERNPYYHYALAQAAFESADYDHALEYINAALGLKYRSGRFHFFKGLTEHKLGRADAAEASFQRAARYGNFRELKRRYVSEVAKAQPLG
jgi:tetratricopeptide (TPR) repeat protein